MAGAVTTEFLEAKRIAVTARAQRLSRLTPRRVGLRPQDMPFAPSADHFRAANQRLAKISARIDAPARTSPAHLVAPDIPSAS